MPPRDTPDHKASTPSVIQDEASLITPHPDPSWSSALYRAARGSRFVLEDGTVIDPDHEDG